MEHLEQLQRRFREHTSSLKQRDIRLVLMGGPGTGKGTQSELIKQHYDVEHLSTGDILREEVAMKTPLGLKVADIMAKGNLVDDESMLSVIEVKLRSLKTKGWLLDGFPRTIAQAEALDKLLEKMGTPLTGIINFSVDDDTIVSRICGRWVHKSSGRSYHESNKGLMPLKMEVVDGNVIAAYDDLTGEPLCRRADDNEESIRARLQSYHKYTEPLLQYYKLSGKLLRLESYYKFETWAIVQLALGEHDFLAIPNSPASRS